MIIIRNISIALNNVALCKLKNATEKKITKPSKDVLTFDYMSGILTKLFDGDEVQK